MKLLDVRKTPSIPILMLAGVFLLVGVFFLPQGLSTIWLIGKILFALGVVLFLFDK